MIATGLDKLIAERSPLRGRSYALLAHAAAVSSELEPAHLALKRRGGGSLEFLLAPEHGYFAAEQDMVAEVERIDPWTRVPVHSLYGDDESSLRPVADLFSSVDLLLVDLQDVGCRYYTYAATAIWAAEAALAAGCEVWVLDRPNPLGGEAIEGNLPRPGFQSFVGAFELPVRHGLTLGEIFRLEARRRGWSEGLSVQTLVGWRRGMTWDATGRPWIAPSPNLPALSSTWLYPGLCLLEATELSEGRGTTRPFQLLGAPGLDPLSLHAAVSALGSPGLSALPAFFRPQHQKHAGQLCAGLELVITDKAALRPYAFGVRLLQLLHRSMEKGLPWRQKPYEFVADRPAIDLLVGGDELRTALDSGEDVEVWLATWRRDEEAFAIEREDILLYASGAGR
jgi:uncharacterized protein YbbC (DUF1343 family)